jgi:hypothetical protein
MMETLSFRKSKNNDSYERKSFFSIRSAKFSGKNERESTLKCSLLLDASISMSFELYTFLSVMVVERSRFKHLEMHQ